MASKREKNIALSATALQYLGEKLSLAPTFSKFFISNPQKIPMMDLIPNLKVYQTAFHKSKKCVTPFTNRESLAWVPELPTILRKCFMVTADFMKCFITPVISIDHLYSCFERVVITSGTGYKETLFLTVSINQIVKMKTTSSLSN